MSEKTGGDECALRRQRQEVSGSERSTGDVEPEESPPPSRQEPFVVQSLDGDGLRTAVLTAACESGLLTISASDFAESLRQSSAIDLSDFAGLSVLELLFIWPIV